MSTGDDSDIFLVNLYTDYGSDIFVETFDICVQVMTLTTFFIIRYIYNILTSIKILQNDQLTYDLLLDKKNHGRFLNL